MQEIFCNDSVGKREMTMMLFAILFDDEPRDAANIRRQHMPAHLDFLQVSSEFIRAAGPLRETDGTIGGGMWIVEARNLGEVERLIAEDPFWTHGLRRSVRMLIWEQVFVDGVCLLRP
jgi:uncharacterized protein YciI